MRRVRRLKSSSARAPSCALRRPARAPGCPRQPVTPLLTLAAAVLALSAGCSSPAENVPKPPPLPAAPASVRAAALDPDNVVPQAPHAAAAQGSAHKQSVEAHGSDREQTKRLGAKEASPEKPAQTDRGLSLYELEKRGEAKLPDSSPKPVPVRSTPPASVPEPATVVAVPKKPADKPRGRVVVPATDRVHVDVPSALQDALDLDPRMQPFVNQALGIVDRCYANELKSSASAAGVVTLAVTMHENERPSARVTSLPPQLGGLLACVTGSLLSAKMPLFTGQEGQQHQVRIRFGQ